MSIVAFQRFLLTIAFCLSIYACGSQPHKVEIASVTALDALGENAMLLYRQNILGIDDNERIQMAIDYALKLRKGVIPFVPTDLCKGADDKLTCINDIARQTRETLEAAQ